MYKMGKGKKSTMKHESKMDEPEAAGGVSRNNKKVSTEDVTNTNDTDAPLNSTGSPTTDSTDDSWEVVPVFEDPHDTCDCRTEECESKAVVVWATASDPTDEWLLCEVCQEKDFGSWPANITPPKEVQSNVHNEDEEAPDSKEAGDSRSHLFLLMLQENDYGGSPEPSELPIDSVTQEHKDALISKCSRKKDVPMPHLEANPIKECENKLISHTITPLCNDMATQTAGNKNGNSTVTPSPAVGLAAAKASAPSSNIGRQAQRNKLLRDWQKDAEAIGGLQARIVVNGGAVKKIIFDFLNNDALCPMNSTQIHKVYTIQYSSMHLYPACWTLVSPQLSICDSPFPSPQALKAIVPKPIMKLCLDEMALEKTEVTSTDSDDEEDKAPKKKENMASDDPYKKGAISFKSETFSANTCLYHDTRFYYVDKTNAELEAVKTTVKNMTLETDKLLSEPTNDE
jgi:hypothetical protein